MPILVAFSVSDWLSDSVMPFFMGYKAFGEALEVLALAAIILIAVDLALRGLILLLANRDGDPHRTRNPQSNKRFLSATGAAMVIARLRPFDRLGLDRGALQHRIQSPRGDAR
jgi:hypothetical protein